MVLQRVCEAEAVLDGSIAALDSRYVVALDAVNCATGEFIAREQREAVSKELVLQELGKAASSLRKRLGESLASLQKFDAPIEKATTTSLEALRPFTEGRRLNSAGAFRQAIPFLQRSVELDSNFALGYYLLGTAYGNSGQRSLAVENLTKAYELRDRASELEKLSITAFCEFSVLRDMNKAVDTYGFLLNTYPRDYPAHHLLGNVYGTLGRFEDGLAYLQNKSGHEAAAEFQKIIGNRGAAGLDVLYPLSHLGLARANALTGDLPHARKSYQDFFAIWKDADSDIPVLIQARQDYAKLNAGND